MRTRVLLLAVILVVVLGSSNVYASFEAELTIGRSESKWHSGLFVDTKEFIPRGFLGYELVGLSGFVTHDTGVSHLSGWVGWSKYSVTGSVSYRYMIYGGNVSEPISNIFVPTLSSHIGMLAEYKTRKGNVAFGGSVIGRVHTKDEWELTYRIKPVLELRKYGTWALSLGVGGEPMSVGASYKPDSELFTVDVEYSDSVWSVSGVALLPDYPWSFGVNWSGGEWSGMVRYSF